MIGVVWLMLNRVSDFAWIWLHISIGIPNSSRFCIILAFLGNWDGVESVFEVPGGVSCLKTSQQHQGPLLSVDAENSLRQPSLITLGMRQIKGDDFQS